MYFGLRAVPHTESITSVHQAERIAVASVCFAGWFRPEDTRSSSHRYLLHFPDGFSTPSVHRRPTGVRERVSSLPVWPRLDLFIIQAEQYRSAVYKYHHNEGNLIDWVGYYLLYDTEDIDRSLCPKIDLQARQPCDEQGQEYSLSYESEQGIDRKRPFAH